MIPEILLFGKLKGRLDNTLEREKEKKGRTCIHVAATE